MAKRRPYRVVVDTRKALKKARPQRTPAHAPARTPEPSETTEKPRAHFLRFMASSASCSALDQLLAAALFSLLRTIMAGSDFLRILISNVLARCVSLSLNYALNRRLVFTFDVDDPEWQRSSHRESLPRYLILSAAILALSTLGVFAAHRLFGAPEWQAKIVVDICLFFLNYRIQRTWVFNNDVTVPVPRKKRP